MHARHTHTHTHTHTGLEHTSLAAANNHVLAEVALVMVSRVVKVCADREGVDKKLSMTTNPVHQKLTTHTPSVWVAHYIRT